MRFKGLGIGNKISIGSLYYMYIYTITTQYTLSQNSSFHFLGFEVLGFGGMKATLTGL